MSVFSKDFATPIYFSHKLFGKLKLLNLTYKDAANAADYKYIAKVENSEGRVFNISIPYCLHKGYIASEEIDFLNILYTELCPDIQFDSAFDKFTASTAAHIELLIDQKNPSNYLDNRLGLKLSNTPITV